MASTVDSALPAAVMDGGDIATARGTRGFMPDGEGLTLHRAGLAATAGGAMLEVGGYCGKSAVYLGCAARATGAVLFSVDHHRGSEENQPGELYCDPAVIDGAAGGVDSLPHFRHAVATAGLEPWVVAVVGRSATVAAHWRTPLALLFIDGGHSEEAAQADYSGFAPHLEPGSILAIHDVFPDPADGGQAPCHVYLRALADGFSEVAVDRSLRVLRR